MHTIPTAQTLQNNGHLWAGLCEACEPGIVELSLHCAALLSARRRESTIHSIDGCEGYYLSSNGQRRQVIHYRSIAAQRMRD
jgi:hypothetical protein